MLLVGSRSLSITGFSPPQRKGSRYLFVSHCSLILVHAEDVFRFFTFFIG